MRNMFVSDVRRLFRLRTFYLALLAVSLVIMLMTYGTWVNTQEDVSALVRMAEEETGQDLAAVEGAARAMSAMGMSPQMMLRRQMTTRRLLTAPFRGPLLEMLLCGLAALLMGRDFQTGYLKNLVSLPFFRRSWFWSKWAVMVLAALILFLWLFPMSLLGTLLLGNPVNLVMAEALPVLLGNFLACVALISLVMLVLMLTQNKTAAMVFSAIVPSGFLILVYKLIDLARVLPFKLSGALLMEQTLALSETGITPRFLWTAGILTAGSLVISRLLLERRDLKV